MERFVIRLAGNPGNREAMRIGAATSTTTLDDMRALIEAEQTINRLTGVRIHICTEAFDE